MVKKLRSKFIFLSMTSVFLLLFAVVAGMNIINYKSVVSGADEILSVISRNEGHFPDFKKEPPPDGVPKRINGETPYESRFFSVVLNTDGGIVLTDTSRIALISASDAVKLAQDVFTQKKNTGFLDNYRYMIQTERDNYRITFLDCTRALDSFGYFCRASVIMAAAGFFAVFAVIEIFSGKIIKPIAESYEKQKRFITDAGHEIKTPLTIIGANADLLESDTGENECINDIRRQTERLSVLTEKLVYLTKMEEDDERIKCELFSLSDMINEILPAFEHLADSRGKQIHADIENGITIHGDETAVGQLVSVLFDNAVKYSPSGGGISVLLRRQGKHVCITVENPTENRMDKDDIHRIFDRFYRTDKSRSSETGGHGIGLSIAKAVTDAHGGKIKAELTDGGIFRITAVFPA